MNPRSILFPSLLSAVFLAVLASAAGFAPKFLATLHNPILEQKILDILGWPVLVIAAAILAAAFTFSNKRLQSSLEYTASTINTAIRQYGQIRPDFISNPETLSLLLELQAKGVLTILKHFEALANERAEQAQTAVRQVLNSICDAVFIVDTNHNLVWGNRRVEQLVGKKRREILGRHISTLAPTPEAANTLLAHLVATWEKTQPVLAWEILNLQTNEPIACEVFAERVQFINSDILCVSIRDVRIARQNEQSLRQALEELRIAKEAADEANRAKSLFLARASHELRTPMNAIIGISYLAGRDTDSEYARREFGRINMAAQRLLRILNDILDFSKLEAGKLSIELKPMSLDELLHSITDLAALRKMGKNVDFFIEKLPDVPSIVEGDSLRLQQILVNLTDNAIKFTEQGKVTLRIQNAETPGFIRFEVTDQGIGITPEQQARLFQSFEQAETSTARKYGGTGLGLSICKKLVELMGGQIGVWSQPGIGSTFWFEIPLRQLTPDAWLQNRKLSHEKSQALKGKKILVVDDNDINREIALGLLQELGCHVVCVPDGQSALQLLDRQPFDVVLLDLEMPDMDGFTCARHIRENRNPAIANIAIAAMTAHAFGEMRAQAAAAGMNGYITKPLDVSQLEAEILRLIEKNQNLQPSQNLSSQVVPPQTQPAKLPMEQTESTPKKEDTQVISFAPVSSPSPPLPRIPPKSSSDDTQVIPLGPPKPAIPSSAPKPKPIPHLPHLSYHATHSFSSPQATPFLNQRRALALLGGNQALYKNLARQFFDSWVNFSDRWQSAQTLEEQRRIAHTIKGLAASLGCQPLSDHAAKCEQILQSGSSLGASEAQKLAELVQQLRLELLQNVISPQTPHINPDLP